MDWMDEFDPDWAGDPRISTLKRIAFQAERDIVSLQGTIALEVGNRTHEAAALLGRIQNLEYSITRITRENSIATLYFKELISKEEAKRLWDLFQSPDEENHKIAILAIQQLHGNTS